MSDNVSRCVRLYIQISDLSSTTSCSLLWSIAPNSLLDLVHDKKLRLVKSHSIPVPMKENKSLYIIYDEV